jgi:hypothetical protein
MRIKQKFGVKLFFLLHHDASHVMDLAALKYSLSLLRLRSLTINPASFSLCSFGWATGYFGDSGDQRGVFGLHSIHLDGMEEDGVK